MIGGRIIAMALAAIILFFQGGDCVTMLAKSKQASDCCNKGHCNRKNPDPCCQVAAKTNIAQDQAKEKSPLPELALQPAVWVWVPRIMPSVETLAWHRVTLAPSPPGKLGNFRLPLLV